MITDTVPVPCGCGKKYDLGTMPAKGKKPKAIR
jgi:hypothetical protein